MVRVRVFAKLFEQTRGYSTLDKVDCFYYGIKLILQ